MLLILSCACTLETGKTTAITLLLLGEEEEEVLELTEPTEKRVIEEGMALNAGTAIPIIAGLAKEEEEEEEEGLETATG